MGSSFSEFTENYTNQINRRYRFIFQQRNNLTFVQAPNFNRFPNFYNPSSLNYFPPLVNQPLIYDPIFPNNNNNNYFPMPMSQTKPDPKPKPIATSCFSAVKILPFNKNQDITRIRAVQGVFRDQHFPPNTQVFGAANSKFMADFKQKSQMKWERTKVISYHKGNTKNEFVLDGSGKPLANFTRLARNYFSVGDINQGALGSCFFLAVMLGLTRNIEVVSHVMPLDNARSVNVSKGAFHFRFWKLGLWYDLVVDDYLPVDFGHNVLFTRNLKCPNEFWVCLVEKAFAKFAGSFDRIHGGFMEDAALSLSGGIYDIYHSELVLNVTSNRAISSRETVEFKQKLQRLCKNELKSAVPTVGELFCILKYAIRTNNVIGVFSMNGKFTEAFGVFNLHQYNVSDVLEVGQRRFVRVHNPHNVADKIKRSQKYASLVGGVLKGKKTLAGEF